MEFICRQSVWYAGNHVCVAQSVRSHTYPYLSDGGTVLQLPLEAVWRSRWRVGSALLSKVYAWKYGMLLSDWLTDWVTGLVLNVQINLALLTTITTLEQKGMRESSKGFWNDMLVWLLHWYGDDVKASAQRWCASAQLRQQQQQKKDTQ